jgi:hypothetical protein
MDEEGGERMTLFEAIRELKEGQQIMGVQITTSWASPDGGGESRSAEMPYAIWERGKDEPTILMSYANLETQVRIINLPKPKMSLEEGLEKAIREIQSPYINPSYRTKEAKTIADILRSLPIDWQAEADRKEGVND